MDGIWPQEEARSWLEVEGEQVRHIFDGGQADSETQGMSTVQSRVRASRRRSRPAGRGVERPTALDARLSQERQRVAAEIHDLVMQDVSFALARARAITSDPALAADHAEAAIQAGERALAGARSIVRGLNDRDHRPIAEMIEESVRVAARNAPLTVELPDPSAGRPDQETSDTLVHIAREAVTNAVKHGHPAAVSVSLAHEDEWCLRVSDDGCGFDPEKIDAGFGLDSIARQTDALGGSMKLASSVGQGTVIEVSLP